MARKSLIAKQKRVPKFPTRAYSRCQLCGRTRGFLRRTKTCRICFRKLVHAGELPGWVKSSW